MDTYLISENGNQLIIAKWEDKVKKLIELSKEINKAALEQSNLVEELRKEVNQKAYEISCSEK
jgi:hypothetical protein